MGPKRRCYGTALLELKDASVANRSLDPCQSPSAPARRAAQPPEQPSKGYACPERGVHRLTRLARTRCGGEQQDLVAVQQHVSLDRAVARHLVAEIVEALDEPDGITR